MTALFLSDVHLRDCESVKAKLVIRFLGEVASRFNQLFILGDLFDVWPGTDAFLARKFRPVLYAIRSLVDGGCRVHYVEGNHDFCLGRFFCDSLGVNVYPREVVVSLGGRSVYMAHGDLGNPREYGYRLARRLLRASPIQMARSFLPSGLIYEFGSKTSQLSRRYSPTSETSSNRIREVYRQAATNLFARGFEVVIMGHTHLPDDFVIEVCGKLRRYINLGDWVTNFTYLEFDGQEFYTKKHPITSDH